LAALVVGKAVLVANKMSLLRRYDRAPLIQPILYKTAFYWLSSCSSAYSSVSCTVVAPLFRDLAVDPGAVSDLCDGSM
jgi:hypothetical protein